MRKITNYKFLITYNLNGKKQTVGCKTELEKVKSLEMMKHANKPNSGYKNKYTNIKVTKI